MVLAFYYVKRDGGNLIQPHAYYTANVFVLMCLFPVLQLYVADILGETKGIARFNLMIGLSYLSFSVGFFVKKQKTEKLLSHLISKFNVTSVPRKVLNVHSILMILLALGLFAYMAEKSGMGLVAWLRSPRIGYQNYRVGFGHLYVASMALLNFSFLFILFFGVNNLKKLLAVTSIFIVSLYFFGSKAPIVAVVFEAMVYYNFFIKKIRAAKVILMCLLIALVFSASFMFYGDKDAKDALSVRILTYASYYDHGARFFADFDERFEYQYGKEYLSGYWMYVPRAVYPQKPYSYGVVKYVVEKYYPGAGESGHTPAFGGPVEEYLNFGIPGIICIGFFGGYVASLFYVYFLRHKNFLGFVLLSNGMAFSIFPVMSWGAYKVIWYLLNIGLLLFHKQLLLLSRPSASSNAGCRHGLEPKDNNT